MVIAVYPGSFDPITFGHLDVAKRAASIFDRVIVAVYDRPMKNLLFPTAQRVQMVADSIGDYPNISVDTYAELTVQYARRVGAKAIVRGLRAATDFENEFQMAHINHRLFPGVQVVCMMAAQEHSFLSSSSVKEIAELGGPVDEMVPPNVVEALRLVFAERKP
ncbi:MAG: pantetheine-phosphate adenylyltransferase [Herpetosiphon sp.]